MTGTARPSPMKLWQEAGGDGERYRELMRQHGHLLSPGDEGYDETSRNLPCGWPGNRGTVLLKHLDECCLYCLASDCGSCEGAPCQCEHTSLAAADLDERPEP
jgi:hypothetical protein